MGRSNNDDCEHAGLALVQPRRGDTIYQSVHFRYQRNILGTPRASCSKAGQDIASLPSRLLPPEQISDLPGGASRLIQRSEGYVSTVVDGEEVVAGGELTDARPGRLVRGPQLAPSRH